MKIYKNLILILTIFIYSFSIFAQNSTQLYNNGVELAKSGNYIEAEKNFVNVIKMSPYYCLGHYGLGKVLMVYKKDLDAAEKEFKIAVKLDSKLSRGHFYLGMIYMFQKKYVYAIKSFWKSYETDDECIEALYNIGSIYDIMGHPFKSRFYYQKYYNEKNKVEEDIFDF